MPRSHYSDETIKDQIALHAFASHLGEVRWNTLTSKQGLTSFPTKEFFRDTCSIMLGVEGRPVETFLRKYLSHLPEVGTQFVVPINEIQEA